MINEKCPNISITLHSGRKEICDECCCSSKLRSQCTALIFLKSEVHAGDSCDVGIDNYSDSANTYCTLYNTLANINPCWRRWLRAEEYIIRQIFMISSCMPCMVQGVHCWPCWMFSSSFLQYPINVAHEEQQHEKEIEARDMSLKVLAVWKANDLLTWLLCARHTSQPIKGGPGGRSLKLAHADPLTHSPLAPVPFFLSEIKLEVKMLSLQGGWLKRRHESRLRLRLWRRSRVCGGRQIMR